MGEKNHQQCIPPGCPLSFGRWRVVVKRADGDSTWTESRMFGNLRGDFEARILNACAFTNAEIVCPRSHLICLCVQPPPPPATTLSLRRHTSHSLSSSATSPLAPCVRVCTNPSRDRPPVFAPPVFAALSRDKPPPPPDAGEYDHNGREARGSALWRPDL